MGISYSLIVRQKIVDTVINDLNQGYESFMTEFPDFKGSIGIFGHSLGGIISYDILANHRDTHLSKKTTRKSMRPSPSHEIIYRPLSFRPTLLFTAGSPISAGNTLSNPPVIVMRGLDIQTYTLPNWVSFFNIFHLYDPLGYRIVFSVVILISLGTTV